MSSPYTIQSGDTLSAIAAKNNTTVAELLKFNPSIKDPNKIFAGGTINFGPTTAPAATAATSSTQTFGTPTGGNNQTTQQYLQGAVDAQGNPIRDERGDGTLEFGPQYADTNTADQNGEIAESMNLGGYSKIPRLTAEESAGYASRFGLGGTKYEKEFTGMTAQEAQMKAQEIQNTLKGQVSQNTSYSFNPETISGAKKAVDNLTMRLKDTMANTWYSSGTQQELSQGLLESTANDIAKLFSTPEEFNNNYNNNLGFKNAVDSFVAQGGKMDSITSRIQPTTQDTIENSRRDVVTNLMQQGVTDPNQVLNYVNFDNKGNKVGDFTLEEVQSYMSGGNYQDTASYLAGLGANPTPEAIKAYETIIPETQQAQAEIARIANIPKQLTDLYFGTAEQIGLVQAKRIQAEEKARILKQKEADAETDYNLAADLTIKKQQAEVEQSLATIEENRLNAKNYMTGALAKLGALNTTGAAPTAIATLDEKYQRQATLLKSKADLATQEIKNNLLSKVNGLKTALDEKINDIQGDLTKDQETIMKEIFKETQASNKEISGVISKYNTLLRTQTEKYTKQSKTESDKYIKDYLSLAGKGYSPSKISSILKGDVSGVQIGKGKKSSGSFSPDNLREIERGGLTKNTPEVKNFFVSTEPAFRQAWVRNYQNGQNKNPTIENITNSYNQWKTETAAQKKASTKKTSSGRVLPGK